MTTRAIRFMALLACLSPSLPLLAWADSWKTESVDLLPPPGLFALGLSLDEQGAPHMAYLKAGTLVHAFRNAGSWSIELVDSIASSALPSGSSWSGTSIPSASLAAAGDRLHIAFLGTPPVLKHLESLGSSWSIEVVDDRASSSTKDLALALDASGGPHISYCGYPSPTGRGCGLKHAFKSLGVWQTEAVDSTTTGSGMIDGTSSVLAMQGSLPHIVTSTNRGFQYTLRYTSKAKSWFMETITEDGGADIAMALDLKGRPHVAWAVDGAIRHAWRTAPGEWQIDQFAESAEPSWSNIAIAVDAHDNVHIVTCHEDGVRYLIRRKSGDWQAETVDQEAGGVYPFTRIALALDAQGAPHIAYIGVDEVLAGNRYLRYAHRGPE